MELCELGLQGELDELLPRHLALIIQVLGAYFGVQLNLLKNTFRLENNCKFSNLVNSVDILDLFQAQFPSLQFITILVTQYCNHIN